MRILIVKMSSLGDVIHTLPALTDAIQAYPDARFDWVVENSFAEVPSWHSAVKHVIPVSIRKWRKRWFHTLRGTEWAAFRAHIQAEDYDLIIDAQGLMKSALVARMAQGVRAGLDWHSAWEPLASFLYQHKISVNPHQHAIVRVRELFAKALQYPVPNVDAVVDYGIDQHAFSPVTNEEPYIVFLHGTTWATKHWPESSWLALCERVTALGLHVKLPWGNEAERMRALRIAAANSCAEVLPALNLQGVATVLAGARAAVAVDTGLGHLAAALSIPCLSLYGPTDPKAIGTRGLHQVHLKADFTCDAGCIAKRCVLSDVAEQAACMAALSVETVFQKLSALC